MSIINKLLPNQTISTPEDLNKLSLQELEFLLKTLKTTQLVGEQVEMFYILVTKLQNQYLQQEAK
jgi:hypothetical protein